MLTALARCCSAALTPTFSGSTSSPMSRSVPARRAVTVPPPPPPAMATPSPRSLEAVAVAAIGARGTAAGRPAGWAGGGAVYEDCLGGFGGGDGIAGLQLSSLSDPGPRPAP